MPYCRGQKKKILNVHEACCVSLKDFEHRSYIIYKARECPSVRLALLLALLALPYSNGQRLLLQATEQFGFQLHQVHEDLRKYIEVYVLSYSNVAFHALIDLFLSVLMRSQLNIISTWASIRNEARNVSCSQGPTASLSLTRGSVLCRGLRLLRIWRRPGRPLKWMKLYYMVKLF